MTSLRWFIVFSVVTMGCVASLPADHGISADLAVEAARMVTVLRQAQPPAPDAPAGECENCNGTGKIGDGRIVMTCPVCNGTGKGAASVLRPTVFVPLASEGTR